MHRIGRLWDTGSGRFDDRRQSDSSDFGVLSKVKDLKFVATKRKQVVRFAQDDKAYHVVSCNGSPTPPRAAEGWTGGMA
jgi:hypothetical protein